MEGLGLNYCCRVKPKGQSGPQPHCSLRTFFFFFFFCTFFFFTSETIFPPSPPLPSFGKLEGRMNYCHLLMAEVHCSMEILLLNNCGDEAEPTTPFCAFYKEGKGGTDVPVFMHRSGGVWAFHTLISMRIPCGVAR